MNRPWHIWTFSALIALLVFGAMAMITRHTLGLEKERARAEAKAELEERIRLALWRMDTSASGILAEENNRPAWHFRDIDLRRTGQPSPLNLQVPENVKLHFEINNGAITTPQVNPWSAPEPLPLWSARESLLRQGKAFSQQNGVTWGALQSLLNNDATFIGWQKKRNTLSKLADNNLGVICAVAYRGAGKANTDIAANTQWDVKVAEAQQQRMTAGKADVRSMKGYQGNYNAAEKAKRNEIVQKSSRNRVQSKKNAQWVSRDKAGGLKDAASAKPSVKKVNEQPTQAKEVAIDKRMLGVGSEEGLHLTSLIPVWLGDDLILVREVTDGMARRVQGVWLDAKSLRVTLLKDVHDLLPGARLEPVRQRLDVLLGDVADPAADDPMVLAALPWRLLPGEVAVVEPVGWTPMRKTLGMAWMGAILAALAAVVLLRGVVKLSERRASFVSSVTHELRTPLTTFSLYSDMLAEGMVEDEEKQKSYLRTLRKESARLTHLVENVLAYSRIERGSARARVESVQVGVLVDRMCERLRTRADEAGMELHCDVSADVAVREIEVDTTAVEQIVFNLVDNASKYAAGEEGGGVIKLRAIERGKYLVFQVCDDGPGIAKSEHQKLFRAFHKSAKEAAHSKPGVGLGLALSRRLARALGGDLKVVRQEKGACFELSVRV